jgi:hypothetical protein
MPMGFDKIGFRNPIGDPRARCRNWRKLLDLGIRLPPYNLG